MNLVSSYSSAGILPVKLLKKKENCISSNGDIIPIHFQLCPTNVCNLNCSFCSCSNREKKQQLSLAEVKEIIQDFSGLGAKAVTITGGGEPICHPDLPEILRELNSFNIKIGLVTNGLKLAEIKPRLPLLTWCRVSCSDDRDVDALLQVLESVLPGALSVDWAFSYVVTKTPDYEKITKIIQFANKHDFTHVRLVSDLLDLENVFPMEILKMDINNLVDDSKVLYQGRQDYSSGSKNCSISLLKPVIAPDGYLYPCCGVQYALPGVTGVFPKMMRLCHYTEVHEYFKYQVLFDGTKCVKCYYQDYNTTLAKMIADYDHEEFV